MSSIEHPHTVRVWQRVPPEVADLHVTTQRPFSIPLQGAFKCFLVFWGRLVGGDQGTGLTRSTTRYALEGKGPRRRPLRRLDGRLEEAAKAVGGRLLSVTNAIEAALGVRGTVAGHRLGALEGGGGGGLPPLPLHPWAPLPRVLPGQGSGTPKDLPSTGTPPAGLALCAAPPVPLPVIQGHRPQDHKPRPVHPSGVRLWAGGGSGGLQVTRPTESASSGSVGLPCPATGVGGLLFAGEGGVRYSPGWTPPPPPKKRLI